MRRSPAHSVPNGASGATASLAVCSATPGGGRLSVALPAIAIVVEHLGPYLTLVLEIQGMSLRATAPATLMAKAGDRFRLGIEPGSLLYFDK